MTTDKIAAVIEACRRAEEARLDAMEAADAAGFIVNFTDGDYIVAMERAAIMALVAKRPAVPRTPGTGPLSGRVAEPGHSDDTEL